MPAPETLISDDIIPSGTLPPLRQRDRFLSAR
jgi:hypothetical protein